MPTNMHICTEKLGISPKLANFSIPLGATVNMDGATINLIISALFLARMYGVSVSGTVLASMVVTMNNTTGDVAVSTIVARSEGLLDKEVYKSKG